MSDLNVVDSSGWIEYLADTERGNYFAAAIEDTFPKPPHPGPTS